MRPYAFLFSLLIFAGSLLTAQNPVKWSFSTKEAGNGQVDLIITGQIEDGWYTYSQFLESDEGPIATTLNFQEGPHFKVVGKAKESGDILKVYDKVFGMTLTKFKHKAVFTQRVEVLDATKPVVGFVNYMVCNDEMCLPPKDAEFSLQMPAAKTEPAPTDKEKPAPAPGGEAPKTGMTETPGQTDVASAPLPPSVSDTAATGMLAPSDPNFKGFFDAKRPIVASKFVNSCTTEVEQSRSLFWTFIAGFLGGMVALLTPCIFPMIPLTVSFFTKRSPTRAKGLRNALWYGASIVVIYVTIGIAITLLFGVQKLNELSTDMYFNLLFFAVFLVFALSFFGLFEITLPASWVNSSDKMADRGGLIGIFFMAFTLALVSFSCTGPIVGTLLVETARSNEGLALLGIIPARPFIGLTGFGLALALPFGLFAMFPGWLNSLPKSGSWMDNVKITLGFVELALAFKFLSTADMVRHWGMLKFEAFLGIWLLLAALLTAYQFGLTPLKGAKGRPGISRLAVGLASLAFTLYLGYGLFNYQSLSLLSGIAPPVHYNFFRPMDCPHGLDCYHDFDEALAVAKRDNKPLFVDFTGYGCVNCRKMEENVWYKPGIIEHLRDNFVVASIYVDDQEPLFPGNKFAYLLDPHTGDKIRTKGGKWGRFEYNNFNQLSQPWYVLMHNDGTTLLNQPRGYTPDEDTYKAFLDCGYEAFQKLKEDEKGLIGGVK